MDQNILRNLGYFSVPNNQTLNTVDQSGLGSSTQQQQSLWDDPALAAAALGRPSVSLSGPAGLSIEALTTATAGSSFNPFGPSMASSIFSQNSRPIIAPRAQRARDGHEKKRSRLNSDSTPFDSVDYWIQFDEDQQQQQQQKQLEQLQQQQQFQQFQQMQQLQQEQRQRQLEQQKTNKQQQDALKEQEQRDREEKKELELELELEREQKQGTVSAVDLSSAATASQSRVPTPRRSTTMMSQTPSSGQLKQEDSFDDSALEKALSDEDGLSYSSLNIADQLSKIDSMPPPEIPPREGLYSTPLSWEKPQMGLRLDSLIGLQAPSLSESEQRRLIAIAMNSGTTSGLGSNLNSNFGLPGSFFGSSLGGTPMSSSSSMMNTMITPSAISIAPPLGSPREKPGKTDKGKEKEKPKSADRTAHNDIERKYRTNLKDRIAELRDAVPALRTIPENAVDDGDDDNQSGRGPKVSKGTVLTKATDYIHYLEKKNKVILQQHQELSRRLQAFEQLLNATAQPTFQMPYSRTLFDPRAFC